MSRLPTGVLVYPAALAMSLTHVLVNLGLVFYARDHFHASSPQIGWIAGIWPLAYTGSCIVLRPRFQHWSAARQVLVTTLGFAAILAGMQIAPGLGWLFALQGLQGALLALFWPTLMGWLAADSEGTQLGARIARFNASWSLGNIVGPYLCGWLTQLNLRLPLAAAAGLMLVTSLFVRLVAPRLPPLPPPPRDDAPDAAAPDASTPLRFPSWLGHFAAYFTVGAVAGIFPIGARDELGCTETAVGLILLIRGVANTAAFMSLGHLGFWHFRLWPLLAASGVGAVAFAALLGSPSVVLVTALLSGANFAAGMSYSASVFHGVSGTRDRTRRMAIHEALIGCGLFAGSVGGGFVYDLYRLRGLYGMCAASLLVTTLAQLAWCRRARLNAPASRGPCPAHPPASA